MEFEETLNIGMLENKLQSDADSEVNNFIHKSTLEHHCSQLVNDCIKHVQVQFDIELGTDVSEAQWLKQIAIQLNSLAKQISKRKLKENNIEVRNA